MEQDRFHIEVLEVADTCFELYTLKELENIPFMLNELIYISPELRIYEALQALSLATSWKESHGTLTYHVN